MIRCVLSLVLSCCLAPSLGWANTPVTINADLHIDFACDAPPDAAAIERFLRRSGFHVLDLNKLPAPHGLDLNIESYNTQRRAIYLFGSGGEYEAMVMGPAPTRHDAELEAKVRDFIARELHCRFGQIDVRENKADLADIVDESFERLRREVDGAGAP